MTLPLSYSRFRKRSRGIIASGKAGELRRNSSFDEPPSGIDVPEKQRQSSRLWRGHPFAPDTRLCGFQGRTQGNFYWLLVYWGASGMAAVANDIRLVGGAFAERAAEFAVLRGFADAGRMGTAFLFFRHGCCSLAGTELAGGRSAFWHEGPPDGDFNYVVVLCGHVRRRTAMLMSSGNIAGSFLRRHSSAILCCVASLGLSLSASFSRLEAQTAALVGSAA